MIGVKRYFVDTNIFAYAHLYNDLEKYEKANFLFEKTLSGKRIIISVQVVNEFYSVMSKYNYSHSQIVEFIKDISIFANIKNMSFNTVKRAFYIKEKYLYSWWDSLILASALENHCEIVYSEDMQNGQIIENGLNLLQSWRQRTESKSALS